MVLRLTIDLSNNKFDKLEKIYKNTKKSNSTLKTQLPIRMRKGVFMKNRVFAAFLLSSFMGGSAFAKEDVVIFVNSKNKITQVSKKELQDFYLGEANKYMETSVKAKLCMNIDSKTQFFQKIDLTENQAESNKAKLLAVGKDGKVIRPKDVDSTSKVIEFILRNPDGGVCFLSKQEFEKLTLEDKKNIKVVFGQ